MSLSHFSLAKTWALIGYSSFVWGIGVLAIRHMGPFLFRNNLNRTLTMAATIPMVHFTIRLTELLFSLTAEDRVAALALANGFAIALDGIAHTWFPTAYENPELQKKNPLAACTISRYGSGWILFFGGICLTMVFFY